MSNGGATQKAAEPITQRLAGVLTVITGGVGALGVTTGNLQNVARNHPLLFVILFSLAVLSVAVGVILPALWHKVPDKVLLPGAVVLLGSMLALAELSFSDQSTAQRPAVSASLGATGQALTVKGAVEANGLKRKEYMVVKVEGRRLKTAAYELIYQARVGANPDGKVTAPVDTTVTAGKYERVVLSALVRRESGAEPTIGPEQRSCDASTPYWGCAALELP